jgi:serine/threonine-protein kinase
VKVHWETPASNLTQAGTVVGSPDYMSPEQARGQDDLNHLTDVWSLGVVLYELISARTPFYATNYNALVRRIIEEEPRSLFELAAADEMLSAIVARCLSKQPAQRFPSMAALGRALAKWLLHQGVVRDVAGTSLETRWLTRPPRAKARASTPSPIPAAGAVLQTKASALLRSIPHPRAAALTAGLTTLSVLLAVVGSFGFTHREPGRAPAELRASTPPVAAATLRPTIASDPPPVQFLALASPEPSAALPERTVPASLDSESASTPIRTAQRRRGKASDLLDPY